MIDAAEGRAEEGARTQLRGVPKILVVIPCLNEEAHLPSLLGGLQASPLAAKIAVADGGSTDASREIVRDFARRDPRFALVENPDRVQGAGVNLAVKAHGEGHDLLLRLDAHGAYPADFIEALVRAQQETQADSVTVRMHAVSPGRGCMQRAIAAVQNSLIGTGGSGHRSKGSRRWVDHGHHALFRTEAYIKAGGYDENFSPNEDAELDLRIAANGGRILLDPTISYDYYPRASLKTLYRQYFRYGDARAKTYQRHKKPLKIRQMLPLGVLPAALLVLASPVSLWFAAPCAAWMALCLAYGTGLAVAARDFCVLASGVCAITMHMGWAIGFWRQLLFGRKPGPLASHLRR